MNPPEAKLLSIVLPDLRGGGVERMRVNMAPYFLAQGYRVEFVVRQGGGELRELLPAQVSVVELGARRVRNAFLPLRRYFLKRQPDAVLVSMWPLTAVAVLAWRSAGLRGSIIISDHNNLSRAYADRGLLHRWFMRCSIGLVYPLASGRVAVSAGVARSMEALGRLPESAFRVIYNPAATTLDAVPERLDPEQEWGGEGPFILAVGRLKRQKNYALLFAAMTLLKSKTSASLLILGDGELLEELTALRAKLQLDSRVRFGGFVQHPAAYYRAADLFVLSSDYEGFGNVLVEALSCGVPVVATDCDYGPREILADGEFGQLVATADPQALALAMEQQLSRPRDPAPGLARASQFRADKIALEYLALLFPAAGHSAENVG